VLVKSGEPDERTVLIFRALTAAADNAGIGICVSFAKEPTPEGVDVLYVNEGAARLLGSSVEEITRRGVWQFFPPEELPRLKQMVEQRLRGEPAPKVFETSVVHSDGRRIPVELSTTPLTLEGKFTNVTFLFDITHRRNAEHALQKSVANFQSLIESAPDGVVIARWPTLVFANPAAARMLGFRRPEDAIGVDVTSRLTPAEQERANMRVERRARGERLTSAEYASRDPDGNELFVEISAIPIEYEGEPAVLAFARDVTERKAMLTQLTEADKLAAVGTLAAGVAHEINNPLAYLLLNLEFMIRELPRLVGDASRLEPMLKRLRETKQGAERVKTIVRDLQTFTRKHDGIHGPVDLEAAIDAALHMARHEVRHRAHLIKTCEAIPAVHGNATRFEQLFLNLLINAAHAVQDLDPKRNRIEIDVRRGQGETVVVRVTDNGIGMTKDVLKRVFDPFFTTKPTGVGTGLGLPICHGIVGAAGGDIQIESAPGVGTTVTVVLRARSGDKRPVRIATPAAFPAARRGRVLIIDDERPVVDSLAVALGDEHDVTAIGSAAEARALFEAGERFDVVLCDLVMPGETGMSLFEHVKKTCPLLAPRFVFMSGGAFLPEAERFLQQLSNPRIDKPFDVAAMRRLVDRMLEEHDV
jgi:PAS domain S-box-containing protein